MNQTAIIPGSIGAIAQQSGKSIAETFLSAEVIVICDTSGSMSAGDSRNNRSRYDVLCEELTRLQNDMPGKIAVINFSSEVRFEPSGHPMFLCGGTNLAKALNFAKAADTPGMKFIVISDGEPDHEGDALKAASKFANHIDVIYVGPENRPSGRDFLQRLAKSTGGQTVTADRAKELASTVVALLKG